MTQQEECTLEWFAALDFTCFPLTPSHAAWNKKKANLFPNRPL